MPLMIINTSSLEETRATIDAQVAEFGPQLKKSNNVGLIIDGNVSNKATGNVQMQVSAMVG